MLKQARELGIKVIFALDDGACIDQIALFAGGAVEGMVCSQPGPPREALSAALTKAFNAKFAEIKRYSPLY